jgi:hypothetical protein
MQRAHDGDALRRTRERFSSEQASMALTYEPL